jgi:hypothetical protein
MQEQLTESEIKKRRRILFGKFGTYAFAMTDEQIQAIYEKMPDKFSQHSNQTTHKRRSLKEFQRGNDR